MKKLIILAAAALALTASACTDTQMAHFGALGSEARVTCYSGGKLIFDDFSTGKVANANGSDGYEFKSRTTGRLEQASGDCVVDYGAQPKTGWVATLP